MNGETEYVALEGAFIIMAAAGYPCLEALLECRVRRSGQLRLSALNFICLLPLFTWILCTRPPSLKDAILRQEGQI